MTDDGIVIETSDLIYENASFPILVTEGGITTDPTELHPINNLSLIDVIDNGILVDTCNESFWSAISPISLYDSVTIFKIFDPILNHPTSIALITKSGFKDNPRKQHPQNASSPILVTDDGMTILVSPLQSLNACLPMLVTDDGIIIDLIEEQS